MDDQEKRTLDMFKRVRDLDAAHDNLFPAGTLGRDLFDTIGGVINDLDGFASAESEGEGTARQGTISKATAKAAINEDLGIFRRTARSMSGVIPGIEEKFPLPYKLDGQELVAAARAALAVAVEHKAEFIRREVQERVYQDLETNLAAYEAALTSQNTGKGARQEAGVSIDAAIDLGMDTLHQLDPIFRNKVHNNPALLAAWLSAKRIERAPRRNKTNKPPTPATPKE
ncbi:MAG: hypothetical protein JOZ02_16865 [Acidobacteria bacterium]|nr:hypothetical protein [Acidobacteriota bacterium]